MYVRKLYFMENELVITHKCCTQQRNHFHKISNKK